MAINFPSTPTEGETYTAGNTTWVWNGVSWDSTTLVSGTSITGSQFISTATTGTAPFTVTSTTQVANLNAATAGTVTTAAQPNITSVGTLSSLTVTGDLTVGTTVLYTDTANSKVGINTTPNVTLDISGTDAVQLPVGNTAGRPTPAAGMIRYNSEIGSFEGYTTQWGAIGGGPLGGFRNKIINGDFDIWQRGTSFSTPAAGPYVFDADRSAVAHNISGSTIAITRQAHTPGQTDVPGNPKFFRRFAQTVAGSAGTFQNIWAQALEDVTRLAGKLCTLTFYARCASGTVDITPLAAQEFGTGGSPSSTVNTVMTAATATTSWQRFSRLVLLPSVTGKVLGSNNNDALRLLLQAPPNLVKTIDIDRISFVEGDATAETDPFSPRHPQQELALCQRYYVAGWRVFLAVYSVTGTNIQMRTPHPVSMRAVPSLTATANSHSNLTNPALASIDNMYSAGLGTVTATGPFTLDFIAALDAEL